MLILDRRNAERIFLGNNVIITVVKCQSGRVKLSFEAPKDLPIVRAEVAHKYPQYKQKSVT